MKWLKGTNTAVSYTPGINTKMGYAYADCLFYAKKLGVDFGVVINNPTQNIANDALRAEIGNSNFGFMTQAALETRRVMLSLYLRNPKSEHIHFCHSNGALHTKQALASLPDDVRKRITVIAIAPQCLIGDELCKKAYHIGSDRDWLFGRAIRNANEGNFSSMQKVKSKMGDWDHSPRSMTIIPGLNDIIDDIQGNLE